MAENRRSRLFGYYKQTAWRRKFFGLKNNNLIEINHDDE